MAYIKTTLKSNGTMSEGNDIDRSVKRHVTAIKIYRPYTNGKNLAYKPN